MYFLIISSAKFRNTFKKIKKTGSCLTFVNMFRLYEKYQYNSHETTTNNKTTSTNPIKSTKIHRTGTKQHLQTLVRAGVEGTGT